MAIFVTRMAAPIAVRILARQASAGRGHAVAVVLEHLILSAAGAGASMGPKAGEA